MNCACGKRLSRKTARQIDGVVMCSTCMFSRPKVMRPKALITKEPLMTEIKPVAVEQRIAEWNDLMDSTSMLGFEKVVANWARENVPALLAALQSSQPPTSLDGDQERGLEEADEGEAPQWALDAFRAADEMYASYMGDPDGMDETYTARQEAAKVIERAAIKALSPMSPPNVEHAAPQAVLLMVRSWVNKHTDSCASQSQIATTDGFRVECICDLPSRLLAVDQAIAALSPSSATEERERIVAWLREQAKAIDPARNSNGARKFLWESAADAIERGEAR